MHARMVCCGVFDCVGVRAETRLPQVDTATPIAPLYARVVFLSALFLCTGMSC